MPSARIHFPRLCLAHPPKLDLPVISAGHDERQGRMEACPVDASVVSFQHILHYCVCVSEKIRLTLIGPLHLVLEAHGLGSGHLLSETGDVPDSDSGVHGC